MSGPTMMSAQASTLRVAPGKVFQPVYYAHGKYAHGIRKAGDKYIADRRNRTIYGLEPLEQECATPEEALAWCQSDYDGLITPDTGPVPGPDPEPGSEPTLNSINPSSARIGAADLTMNVNGTNFTDTSLIYFNGGAEPTTFVDTGQLSTVVKPSTATVEGAFPVWVQQGSFKTATEKTFTFLPAGAEEAPPA